MLSITLKVQKNPVYGAGYGTPFAKRGALPKIGDFTQVRWVSVNVAVENNVKSVNSKELGYL